MLPTLETPVAASVLAVELGLAYEGPELGITGVTALSAARAGTLTFATKGAPDALPHGVCVITASDLPASHRSTSGLLRAASPRLAFVKALLALERLGRFARPAEPAKVHPSAHVSSGVAIGKNVVIGEGTYIEPNVTIHDNTIIGRDCLIKASCVIGGVGFGFERDDDGTPLRMLHFGGVEIGDRVEVGSSTTVCRGTLGPTVVEDDAKIDDHVHVAHNVRIGRKSLVIACAELSGGVVLGEGVWVGPNASVLEKVKIGDHALVGLGAVVLRDVSPGVTVVGNPARVLERKPR